jgi:uncharacterized paraquat-inducible protein A
MTTATQTTDLGILTTDEFRAEFKTLRRNALHCVSKAEWMEAVTALLPEGEEPTPQDWVMAAEQATTHCDRCQGSGTYVWGAVINGKPSHSGDCYRCEGKGYQNQYDYMRNAIYDRHAIVNAFRQMVG